MKQNRWLLIISIIICNSIFLVPKTYAAVTVTAGTNGTNISADNANNAISPARTTLGQIRIAEGANTDIPANVNNGTIILTIATGRQFNTSAGTISNTNGRDITSISLGVTATTITITLSTDSAANKIDIINIDGIQVMAISGLNIPAAGNILRRSTDPGTVTVVGITNNSTNFGSLSQVIGALSSLAIVLPGQSWGGSGVGVLGIPNYIFPNLQFTITKIKAVDQFYNIFSTFAGSKTLTYDGVSTASGANSYTTTVSFTNGDSTTTLNTTLRPPGNFEMTVRSGTVVYGTSSQFTILNGAYNITAPGSISLPTLGASNSQNIIRGTSNSFSVEDQKGLSAGYYTTLQCSNLVAGSNSISNSNISLSGSTLTLLSGNTNGSVTTSLGSSMQTCNGAIAFIRRNTGAGGAGIYSEYGANIRVQVTIPPRQAVGDYSSTITYTLIEN